MSNDTGTMSSQLEHIIKTVSNHYVMTPGRLTSSRKDAWTYQARRTSMWLCRQLTGASMKLIAQAHRASDHTLVVYAVQKTEKELETSPCGPHAIFLGQLEWELSGHLKPINEGAA
jgi:chromosomal replication initiation ATPase DnaA